ncbi:Hypothetical predicted protein [Podarcis lilfordi]|uniref:Uncharacterized protein n=1 Tax=Podarcis lilfordi TaxID=74358 RepID=A0AA35JYS4_9SAUR|nr:Hypothetical predicted protein [Podarcis lilfordi]
MCLLSVLQTALRFFLVRYMFNDYYYYYYYYLYPAHLAGPPQPLWAAPNRILKTVKHQTLNNNNNLLFLPRPSGWVSPATLGGFQQNIKNRIKLQTLKTALNRAAF